MMPCFVNACQIGYSLNDASLRATPAHSRPLISLTLDSERFCAASLRGVSFVPYA
jgi:hypothetical protein